VPKKAVATFLLLALFGAVVYVYFTFPRTKDEIPQSNNQRPFPSAPGPNGLPVPETVPHPTTPKPPTGPTLRVMAWASPIEAQALQAKADAFEASTGTAAALTIDNDLPSYRRDLQEALASGAPPDVCLIEARDFSGIDPAHDLVAITPPAGVAERSIAAFTVNGQIMAVPAEFSVDMLFYNPQQFDQAGIGYPDRHWTWDIMEGITRALSSMQMKTAAGARVYPLELTADFDLWNILCTQAGHPALDRETWHLADSDGKDSQLRALSLIDEFFHELAVTAPMARNAQLTGSYFAQQRAALLIAPSEITASLPKFDYRMTVLPSDLSRASLARVSGWAVTARSDRPEAARALAVFLAAQPLHSGWSPVQKPADDASNAGLCYEALEQALIPRIVPRTERLAQLLDQQISLFARDPQPKTTAEGLYAQIQTEYEAGYAPASDSTRRPSDLSPKADVPQLRGL
jgi:ABC-type glycerol-3-phosphate transport system substrate-binding protein